MQTEAVVLDVIPFQDYHQILTLFSPHHGIIKAIARFSLSAKSPFKNCLQPSNLIEATLQKKRGDLEVLEKVEVINSYPQMRATLEALETGCSFLNTLKRTQVAGKPAPLVFQLLIHYLELLPQMPFPEVLESSFKLKLLMHEGQIALKETCAACGNSVQEWALDQGELYCHSHAKSGAILFDKEEVEFILALTFTTSKRVLRSLEAPLSFRQKIHQLFLTHFE